MVTYGNHLEIMLFWDLFGCGSGPIIAGTLFIYSFVYVVFAPMYGNHSEIINVISGHVWMWVWADLAGLLFISLLFMLSLHP